MLEKILNRVEKLETRRGRKVIYFDNGRQFQAWQEGIGAAAADRFLAIVLAPPSEAVDWEAILADNEPPGLSL
jgi:hypothetical protein